MQGKHCVQLTWSEAPRPSCSSAVQVENWIMPLVCWNGRHVSARSKRHSRHTHLRPDGEVLLVEREVLLELADGDLVLEEEDGAVAGLEARELLLGGGPLLLGDDGLEDLAGDVPELLVLGLEEHDDARAL